MTPPRWQVIDDHDCCGLVAHTEHGELLVYLTVQETADGPMPIMALYSPTETTLFTSYREDWPKIAEYLPMAMWPKGITDSSGHTDPAVGAAAESSFVDALREAIAQQEATLALIREQWVLESQR